MVKPNSKQSTPQTSMKQVAVAYTKPTKSTKPRIVTTSNSRRESTVVTHREFISDLSGSQSFAVTAFPVNPGSKSTFPWLSTLAQLFETYRFRKLNFSYEPTCGSGTDGSVQLAMDFDASDPSPKDKQQIMSYHNAVRISPWSNIKYAASQSDLTKFASSRYVRSGDVPPNTDIKTYDCGNFFIATSNSTETSSFGELYVEYEIELFTPQIPASKIALFGEFSGFVWNNSSAVSNTQPFGPAPQVGNVGSFENVDIDANGVLIRQPGRYILVWSLDRTNAQVTTARISAITGGSFNQLGDINRPDNVWVVNVASSDCSIDFELACSPAPTKSILRITPYPDSLIN